jgi:hypothetical protein
VLWQCEELREELCRTHQAEVEEVQRRRQVELDEVQRRHQAEMDGLERRREAQLEELRAGQQAALDAQAERWVLKEGGAFREACLHANTLS